MPIHWRSLALLAMLVARPAFADDTIPFLGTPGLAANAFPAPSRPVATIISPMWHDEDERDAAKEVSQLIDGMGIKAGITVADIGAGNGYYTVRLSPLVGENGRILAQDVMPKYLAGLLKRVRDLKLGNVTVGLGEPHDPRLPPQSLDAAIMIHMYHEIAQPFAFMANLKPALKPGAKVGIIDANRRTASHGTPPDLLRCEMEAMNYAQISFKPLKGTEGYLAIFQVAEGQTAEKNPSACKQAPG